MSLAHAVRTDLPKAGETARAVETIDLLIDHHTALPGGRLVEVASYLRDYNHRHPEEARRLILRAFGYVPADPQAWLRVKVSRHRFDGPVQCPGFGEF